MKQYFTFQWHITDACDQRCKHCYIFAEDHSISLKETSLSDINSIFQNCLDMCTKLDRIPYFYITGGDPLLHKDFWKLVKILKEHSIAFGILGNPFHLNQEVCEKLKFYGCDKYQMSLDGLEQTHDFIRKTGSFTTTLEKIDLLKKADIKSAIMTTVSKLNLSEIPKLIDTVVHYEVDIFAFARYCPTSLEKNLHISPQEYKYFLEICWKKFEDYKDSKTAFNLKDHLWTLFLYEKGEFIIPSNLQDDIIYDGCNCANSHLTILPNGDVLACRRMDSTVGNVYKERLDTIFLSEKMDDYRNYEAFEKCSKCELLRFCRGCPAVAYGYTHNMYSPDPQCWKVVS